MDTITRFITALSVMFFITALSTAAQNVTTVKEAAAACGYGFRHHHHALADAEVCARIALSPL